MTDRGYDTDLALWAEDQARVLRDAGHAGTNLPVDWGNVAEEIESLGRSQGRELASRIAVVLEHLMKLETSSSSDPRDGWMDTITRERDAIERVLKDSPSLRRTVPDVIGDELGKARRLVARALSRHGEQPGTDLEKLHYGLEQVLGDWFPDGP
jgi:hypothetical protein